MRRSPVVSPEIFAYQTADLPVVHNLATAVQKSDPAAVLVPRAPRCVGLCARGAAKGVNDVILGIIAPYDYLLAHGQAERSAPDAALADPRGGMSLADSAENRSRLGQGRHDLTTPSHCCGPGIAATLLAAALQAGAGGGAADLPPLTAAELGHYRGWLAQLEQPQAWPDRTAIAPAAAALRQAVADGDTAAVDQVLVRQAAAPQRDAPTRFWCAFALAYRERWADSLLQLRGLLGTATPPAGLDAGGVAWAVTALADEHFLLGARQQARELYVLLATSARHDLRSWGTYQLANLDLLAAEYDRAADGFASLCEVPDSVPWRDHACAMAAAARNLGQLNLEVEPYGVAAYDRQ